MFLKVHLQSLELTNLDFQAFTVGLLTKHQSFNVNKPQIVKFKYLRHLNYY